MPMASGTGIRGVASGFDSKDVICLNVAAETTVVGRVYQLDLADTDTNITAANEAAFIAGDLDSDPTIRIVSAAASTSFNIYVVALFAVADNASGKFRLQGLVEVLSDGTGHSQGDGLDVDANGDMVVSAVAGDTVVAVAMEDAGADAGGQALFDGLHGFKTF